MGTTTNYGWEYPDNGGDVDNWGVILTDLFEDIDGQVKANQTAALATASSLAGMVAPFATSTVPTGWLECAGAAVSRTTYADLFARIGTTWGAGDGSTTFTLPDLRGEFVRGWDNGKGTDSGRAFASSQTDAFQGHQHVTTSTGGGNFTGTGTSGLSNIGGGTAPTFQSGNPVTDGSSGTPRTAAETRPRNFALMYCIKT